MSICRSQIVSAISAAMLFLGSAAVGAAETVPLDRLSHVHGLSVDASDPARLLLATHDGLYSATADGPAVRVSELRADMMGFAAHPTDRRRLFASGHPPEGGNLGVMLSEDAGRSWRPLSPGAGGPVDFHILEISRVDPDLMFGVHGGLQVSRDGGKSWTRAGELPKDVFDLATSMKDARTLYAAARDGLYASRDTGGAWRRVSDSPQPMTTVHVTAAGRLYVFIYRAGLYAADEAAFDWTRLSDRFLDRALFYLTADPSDPRRLYAVADTGTVMTSGDSGRTWTTFAGSHLARPDTIAEGARLYRELCVECHGVRGVGERPDDMYAKDEFGFVAPPLDDSAHGWHHSDSNLIATIMNGSPRNERMAPMKDVITPVQAASIVAYVKSLWNFRSLACQGARHMRCMRH